MHFKCYFIFLVRLGVPMFFDQSWERGRLFLCFFRTSSLRKMCNTIGFFMWIFPLYQCYHQMQRNLTYVQNVGKNLHARATWRDICFFTLVIVHIPALFVNTKLYTNTILKNIFARTPVTDPTVLMLVLCVTTKLLTKATLKITFARTQGTNLSLAMYVGNFLRQADI